MSGHQEEILHGGSAGRRVVRVGDTVRHLAGPWSSSVDSLLLHLEAVGFEGAPHALGYDDLGRQVLSYVPGHATADPGDLNVLAVKHVGHLIRELHDALSTFPLPPTAIWNVAIKPHSTKLICHNDLASWNFVRRTGSTTFIDRDGAGPGSRLWDLAYAAHGFIPLSTRSGLHDTELPERLAALVDGCGLDERERLSLVNLLAPRINSMDQLLHRSWVEGVDPWRTLWSEGHGDAWREDHEFVVTRLNWWMSPCVAIPRLLLDQISHKH